MTRKSLDTYDSVPSDMQKYLSWYGWHFSKNAVQFACKGLKNKKGEVKMVDEDQLESMMKQYGVKLENDEGYDKVWLATMCKADYMGSSIEDECQMCKYVKDVLDDEDGCGEEAFRRWVADMIGRGRSICWDKML